MAPGDERSGGARPSGWPWVLAATLVAGFAHAEPGGSSSAKASSRPARSQKTAVAARIPSAARRPGAMSVAESCRPDAEGFCTAQVVRYAITGGQAELRLNAGLGSVVAVEFPSGTRFSGAPAVGNTAFFVVEGHKGAEVDGRTRLLIRPRLPEAVRDSRPDAFYGQTSNIQVFLVGAPTLNLKVRLVAADQGVFQAVIALPDRDEALTVAREELERERTRLRNEYEERRAELEARIAAGAFERVLEGMVERFECRDLSGRSMRDFLIFRTHAICRIGQHIYINFSVKNRRRASIFHFDELLVVETGRDPSIGTLDVTVRFERPGVAVGFDEEARGVLGFGLPDGARQFGPWNLTLVEDGGANRRVVLEDVGF